MRLVRLASEIDFDGWRDAARALVSMGIAPENIEWTVGAAGSLLADITSASGDSPSPLTVPRKFIELAQRAILNADPSRFGLLYRLLWRLKAEPRLMSVASDVDVVRARVLAHAVDHEIHKTHAFVRFRNIEDDAGSTYVAWFEPTHHTLEAAAPFFARRFAAMRWAILTPRVSAHWDGAELRFGPGATRAESPTRDALEVLWRTYYGSIFNPARLKTRTMQQHMPRKYWRNLPESELIGELVARAKSRTGEMIEQAPGTAHLRAPRPSRRIEQSPNDSLAALRAHVCACTACPLHATATQAVFGEGPERASVMFVGEQPGDQEDLAGRPFVGPAGQLFNRALAKAGIARGDVYVTNAVKHFKFELRGKRRLHKTPGQLEIEACRPWLEEEIARVQPRLIVAMGATAAQTALRRPTPIQRSRGKLMGVSEDTQVLVTVHPSYLLRIPDTQQAPELARFVDDLRIARAFCNAPSRDARFADCVYDMSAL